MNPTQKLGQKLKSKGILMGLCKTTRTKDELIKKELEKRLFK